MQGLVERRTSGPVVLEWYRTARAERLALVVVASALLLVMSAGLGGVVFLEGVDASARSVCGTFAVTLFLTALVLLHVLRRSLDDDAVLVVRTDGLLVRAASNTALLTWDDLLHADYVRERERLFLRRREGAPLELPPRFDEVEGEALARRLNHLRCKAQCNLLRAPS
ncbi:MAG: hypothetical protein AB2A00_09670 [Myxococcota bacterium]